MGLIRKIAVKSYLKELDNFISLLSDTNPEGLAQILIYSVWLRAMIEVEGNLPTIKGENGKLVPELNSYPIKLAGLEKWQSLMNKEKQNQKSLVLSIWVHTLRSIIRPECVVSAKFGPLMIFLKRWFAYNKITQGDMHEYKKEARS